MAPEATITTTVDLTTYHPNEKNNRIGKTVKKHKRLVTVGCSKIMGLMVWGLGLRSKPYICLFTGVQGLGFRGLGFRV